MSHRQSLYIIGTRGVPAQHGGFETFAERLAVFMVERGWNVTVYCQVDEGPTEAVEDYWCGVRRVTFAAGAGAVGTMKFDWKCVRHAMRERGVMLVLGYNTAAFSAALRLRGLPVITNMDGIEWKRAKWPWYGRVWLFLNEWIAALTSTKLVADHPEIEKHLARRRSRRDIQMIPYGGDRITDAPGELVRELGLEPGKYIVAIGRVEPENNVLPLVRAYATKSREYALVVLGKLSPEHNEYHAAVVEAGKGKVVFPGPIYEKAKVQALRFHAAAYCHGHSVGGTNPSLVEALGAGNCVIAHDNPFNRWVAGEAQYYFKGEQDCARIFDEFSPAHALSRARDASKRWEQLFGWSGVLKQYEDLFSLYAQS